jgi:hypothetical protein
MLVFRGPINGAQGGTAVHAAVPFIRRPDITTCENEVVKIGGLLQTKSPGGVDCTTKELPAADIDGSSIDAIAANVHLKTPPLGISLVGGAAASQVLCSRLPEVIDKAVAIDAFRDNLFILVLPRGHGPLWQETDVFLTPAWQDYHDSNVCEANFVLSLRETLRNEIEKRRVKGMAPALRGVCCSCWRFVELGVAGLRGTALSSATSLQPLIGRMGIRIE